MVQTDVTFYKNALIQMLDELPAEQVSEIFTFALFIRNRSQTQTDKPYGVTVKAIPFLDDAEPVEVKKPDRKQFSFRQARERLKNYTGSLSEAVIEERRQER